MPGRAAGAGANEQGVRRRGRGARGQRVQGLSKRKLDRVMGVVAFRIEVVGKEWYPSLLRIGCLIYLYTEQTPSGNKE